MTDVVVIGAGPAGLAAATEAARAGLSVVVLDEYHRPGGRLLGQLHQDPRTGAWVNGLEEAARLVAEADEAGVEVRTGVQVWGVSPELVVRVHAEPQADHPPELQPRAVVLATGAAERPIPVPGWTLPGVLSIGAGQVMVNVHRVRPGQRVLVIGVNVLSLAIARELDLAGVEVVALVLPPPGRLSGRASDPGLVLRELTGLAHLAPSWLLRVGGRLGRAGPGAWLAPRVYPKRGFSAWGIPIQARRAALAIRGDDRVAAVTMTDLSATGEVRGEPWDLEVDGVCIAGGLYPLAELAVAAGAELVDDERLGGEVPLHGPDLQTTVPGLFVAGNVAGVEGAAVAEAWGRAAGVGVAAHLGAVDDGPARLEAAHAAVEAARTHAPIRFHPEVDAGRASVQAAWRTRSDGRGG